jgi:hypothetical protein
MPAVFQHAVGDVAERGVGDRIAAGFVQQHDVLAVGDPGIAESDAHPPAERFGVQQTLGQRSWSQEPACRPRRQRSLLP